MRRMEGVVFATPSVLVVKKDSLIPEDDSPYLVVELDSGTLLDDGEDPSLPFYVYGKVIGRLPHAEAAHALATAVGTPGRFQAVSGTVHGGEGEGDHG